MNKTTRRKINIKNLQEKSSHKKSKYINKYKEINDQSINKKVEINK